MRAAAVALALVSVLLVPCALAELDAGDLGAPAAGLEAAGDGLAAVDQVEAAIEPVLAPVPVVVTVEAEADIEATVAQPATQPVASVGRPPASDFPAASHPGPAAGFLPAPPDGPLARSVFATLALAVIALGADGWRMLHGRAGSLVGRALRASILALPFLSLFSRIEKGRILDNPVRSRVHDLVGQEPGITLTAIQARAGVAWGTAVHHLRRLETHGLVVSAQQAGHHRYYLANSAAAARRGAVAVIAHPTARRIAELVAHRPGIDQAAICQTLGLNNPAASKHLSQFALQGLVLSHRAGRFRQYHATGCLHEVLALTDRPAPSIVLSTKPLPASHQVGVPGVA